MESATYALPATPKQIAYARALALRNQTLLPWDVQQDLHALSAWIDAQARMKPGTQDSRPTSKQVAFAERIARIKRRFPSGISLPSMAFNIEHNRNKNKPPAQTMGIERKRRAGKDQA